MDVLKVTDLKKSYRTGFFKTKHQVLYGVNFSIQKGQITGFLGCNGEGKTTTMKCVLGLAHPDSGSIEFFGSSTLTQDIKRQIGFLPERPYFYDYLTGREFLKFYAELSGQSVGSSLNTKIESLLERVDLMKAKDRPLRSYSKGMLQRIGIAQALIHDPTFIILDEPMSGLDPDGRIKINGIIREVASAGTTVFFSSHLINDMEILCERLVIINQGVVVYEGLTQDLLRKLQTGFRISYSDGEHLRTVTCATEVEMQKKLDEIRSERKSIQEIRAERPSLEEAFSMIARRGG